MMKNLSSRESPLRINVWTQTNPNDEYWSQSTCEESHDFEQVFDIQMEEAITPRSCQGMVITKSRSPSPPERNQMAPTSNEKCIPGTSSRSLRTIYALDISGVRGSARRVQYHEHPKGYMMLVRKNTAYLKRLIGVLPFKERMQLLEKELNDETLGRSEVEQDASLNKIIIPRKLIEIGPNQTKIPLEIYRSIDYTCASKVTRKLLRALFTRKTLATHTLAGAQAPVFYLTKPKKLTLKPEIIQDIISFVTQECNVSKSLVKTAILAECFKEDVLLKRRRFGITDESEESD